MYKRTLQIVRTFSRWQWSAFQSLVPWAFCSESHLSFCFYCLDADTRHQRWKHNKVATEHNTAHANKCSKAACRTCSDSLVQYLSHFSSAGGTAKVLKIPELFLCRHNVIVLHFVLPCVPNASIMHPILRYLTSGYANLVFLPSWRFKFKPWWNIRSPKSRKRVKRCNLIRQDWNWYHLGSHSSKFMTTFAVAAIFKISTAP